MKPTLLLSLCAFLSYSFSFAQFNFSDIQKIGDAGTNPQVIMTQDVNNDEFDDILVASRTSNELDLYINNLEEGGDFIKVSITNSLEDIIGIAFGDFNGDGFEDIVAAGSADGALAWYPNDQSGGFNEEIIIATVAFPGSVVSGKIDGNDSVDIAIAVYGSGETLWFANDGDGNFSDPNTIYVDAASGPIDLDLGDFDGDGDLDVVVGNQLSGTVEVFNNGLIPDGTASFTKYNNTVATGSSVLFDVLFADINDDEVMDIVKSDIGGQGAISYYTTSDNTISTEFIEVPVTLASIDNRVGDLVVADFTGDGYNDLIYANAQGAGDIFGYVSDDAGGLNAAVQINNSQAVVYSIALGDFDNDGSLDLASSDNNNSNINILINDVVLVVEDYGFVDLEIYPNPTTDILNIKGLLESNLEYEIFDFLGKKILESTLNINQQINVSYLDAGVFFLKLKDRDGTFKFIKE